MKIFLGKFPLLLVAVGMLFHGAIAVAEEEKPEEITWEQWFIKSNIAVSQWFDGIAEGLDLFLVGRRLTTRPNESFVRIENATVSSEGQSVTNSTSFIVNPRLPNLEEYWHLKFTTYDEQEESRNAKNDYLRQTQRRKNYGATIGLFRKLGNVRTAFQPRIELTNPLKVSHSLTFESVAESKDYLINPKLELYASADKGTGFFPALNFNFFPSKYYTVTLINQGDYEDKLHLLTVTNGISLGQALTEKSSLSYNLFFITTNRPSYMLQSYNFSISCSQLLYKRILDFQIIPNIDFVDTRDFKGAAGLTVVFNLNF
jgi:hypothetical protein